MKQKFMVIYEHGKRNHSGFAPDVLGRVSVGDTLTEMRSMMKEALEAHLGLMPKTETIYRSQRQCVSILERLGTNQ